MASRKTFEFRIVPGCTPEEWNKVLRFDSIRWNGPTGTMRRVWLSFEVTVVLDHCMRCREARRSAEDDRAVALDVVAYQ